ncbi:uncharacterized protein LOC108100221 [Drosophila ficusphila]|uniref:uncharacterized protein LOC108100221 n=1 Tax=Drosophila ficusphila TaxID=30025 RepID=UPI0007E88676|nr:uncharacterized protein LOC108100221 [Drosophila ficusphila]
MGAANIKPYSKTESQAFAKFVKNYKRNHVHRDQDEVMRSAENAWGKLTPHQKKHFEVKPRQISLNKKVSVSRPKRANKQRQAVCGMRKKGKKFANSTRSRLGPQMSTGFLRYLKEYQKKNKKVDLKKTLQKGARAWANLTKREQAKFRKVGAK